MEQADAQGLTLGKYDVHKRLPARRKLLLPDMLHAA
jgi:hypothetical protein